MVEPFIIADTLLNGSMPVDKQLTGRLLLSRKPADTLVEYSHQRLLLSLREQVIPLLLRGGAAELLLSAQGYMYEFEE
jgi:hypothetical protein